MINKSILKSKTFWVQALAVIAVLFPAVQAFLAANPVQFVAVLAAVNVIVRFVTSGGISILGDTDETGGGSGGSVSLLLVACTAAGVSGLLALPSCSASQIEAARSIPIQFSVEGRDATFHYSSKDGAEIMARLPDRKSAK